MLRSRVLFSPGELATQRAQARSAGGLLCTACGFAVSYGAGGTQQFRDGLRSGSVDQSPLPGALGTMVAISAPLSSGKAFAQSSSS